MKRGGNHDPPPPYLRPHSRRRKSPLYEDSESIDILFAEKFGKRNLIRWSDGETVDVESLKGKLIGLLFVNPKNQHHLRVGCRDMFDAYYRLKELNLPREFEIVYVTVPPTHSCVNYQSDIPDRRNYEKYYNLEKFNEVVSTLPFLCVPFSDDEPWRYFLCDLYTNRWPGLCPMSTQLTIIDHFGNVLNKCVLQSLSLYGPLLYPFTIQREVQLFDQFSNLIKETDINILLASNSNGGYLINRHHQRVPISQLEDKHVALYAYNRFSPHSRAFLEQLVAIYEQFHPLRFEIVFVNLHNRCGYPDKDSFDDALREMPWLALPFGDDTVWSLEHIFNQDTFLYFEEWFDYPTLFIRAKGEALLDPYGYHVIEMYGLDAYPFTRRAALRSERRRLKTLTFKSFLKEARSLCLDFSSLIKSRDKHGLEVEKILVSDLKLKKRGKGILLVFASSSKLSGKLLESLIHAYNRPTDAASSSFEVIYVSLDKDRGSFRSHLPAMPWFCLQRRLRKKEHKELVGKTIKFSLEDGYCIAFGPRGNFLTMGDLPVSFEDRAFPFINEVEFMNAMGMCMRRQFGWTWDPNMSLGREESIDWLDD